MRNSSLNSAKREKNDEFYTQYKDVEAEMNAYLEYNPNVFRDKVVLLPCDDPTWSNFTKYFVENFHILGLKKLISTSYSPNSSRGERFYDSQLTLLDGFEYDEDTDFERGKIFILENDEKIKDGVIDVDDIQWKYLKGDGDFRSEEITQLRDEADFVITNPPFSLFREFVDWILKGDCRFAVIGNMNAVTYKEVFPLIMTNKIWLGATANSRDMVFGVPKEFEVKENDRKKAERLGFITDEQFNYTRMGNTCWFSSIEHGKRHKPLSLNTKADNEQFNTKVSNNPSAYKKYDNYDAIEVSSVSAIPSDYKGIMGVPISFLSKYCPEQFEILGTQRWSKSQELLSAYTGNCNPPEKDKKTTIEGKEPYDRIFIKHRKPCL